MNEQQKALLEGINTLKNIIENVEKRQEELSNILEKKIEQVGERYERVAGNFNLVSQRVEDFEKKLLACGNATNGSKFVLAALVPVPASPVSVKLYTYDGKTNWKVYKVLICQKFFKDYACLQMKTRHQKPEESLQEYAFEMQRLTTLAFFDFSANVREMICLEYFVDGLKDEEIQIAVRMADFNDLKSALLYSLKVDNVIQASCIDRHSIQEARVTVDEPCESRCIKGIEKFKEEM
ncbi:uncharacterized protein TNCV_1765271 [Trichonephila clavipes]|nr:uncharacterized protein TNCV_1765271 [Trichonephila clavipes]